MNHVSAEAIKKQYDQSFPDHPKHVCTNHDLRRTPPSCSQPSPAHREQRAAAQLDCPCKTQQRNSADGYAAGGHDTEHCYCISVGDNMGAIGGEVLMASSYLEVFRNWSIGEADVELFDVVSLPHVRPGVVGHRWQEFGDVGVRGQSHLVDGI